MQTPPPFPLRPIALEYVVRRGLDGTTPAPAWLVPPAAGAAIVGPDNKIVIEVDDLGLIDLTGFPGAHGQIADRFIKWILIYGPNTPFGSPNVSVAFDGTAERDELTIPAGANGIYSRNCIFVPQSGQLQVFGMRATLADPVIVRIGVWMPQTLLELTAMREACCCIGGLVDAEGEPVFTTAIYTAAACERTITPPLIPTSIGQGMDPGPIVINGSGFAEGDLIALVHEDGIDTLEITTVVVNNPNQVSIAINNRADQTLGAYDLTIAAPLGGPACTATLAGAFTIT